MADQFSRIYSLQTAGVDKVLADVNSVIARIEKLGQVKNAVSNTDIGDPASVSALNAQYNNLVATVDKVAKSQENLADSLMQVIELQKTVTMSMKESTAAMGQNLTSSTAGVTKMQAAFQVTADAAQQFSLNTTELGERLAVVKGDIASTTAQLKDLQEQFGQGALSEEEFTAMAGEANVQLIEQRAEAQALTQILKMQAVAQDAVTGSINEARTTAALYRKELNALNLSTEEGVARQQELIASIAELDNFIKSNADLYTQQKINIGNYPTLGAEFTSLKQQMQQLAAAGEQDSAEFAKLQARALELSGAIKEVNAATKEATVTTGRFESIVERMGLRMLANLVIFQVAIELIEAFATEYKNAMSVINAEQEASAAMAKETANNFSAEAASIMALKARFEDLSSTENDKLEVVDELNDKFGTQIDKINGVSDAERFFVDKSDAFIKALNLRAEATAAINVITQQYQKQLEAISDPAAQLNWFEKMGAGFAAGGKNIKTIAGMVLPVNSGKSLDEIGDDYDWEKIARGAGKADQTIQATNAQIAFLIKQFIQLQNEAQKLDSQFGFNTNVNAGKEKKSKQPKEPHDYLNEQLEAHKKYYEELAKLEEGQIANDQIALGEIYNDENNNLDIRLNAYKIFVENKKKLAELSKAAEIQADQEKLDKIADIENAVANKKAGKSYNKSYFTKSGGLGTQEQTLLDNKGGIAADMAVAKQTVVNGISSIDAEVPGVVSGIVKSSFARTISDVDAQLTDVKQKIQDEFGGKENAVLDSDKSPQGKQKALDKLDNKKAIADDQADMQADQIKDAAISLQLQKASDLQQTELEKKLYADLLKLQQDYLAKKKDANSKSAQDLADDKAKERKIEDAAIGVLAQAADFAMQIAEQTDNIRAAQAQRSLDWNKKLQDGEAQSNAQKLQNDKAYAIQEQQLEREKAKQERERAQEKLVVNYAVALMKAFADEDDPFSKALAAAEATVTFGFAEAELASAPTYAKGTPNHPGGLAVIGDGGEPELLRIGNMFAVSPSTSTLTNLPAGTQVTPFSQLGGNLSAPSLSAGRSGVGADYTALHQSVAALHNSIGTVAAGLRNMQINYNPNKAVKANNNAYYKNVTI